MKTLVFTWGMFAITVLISPAAHGYSYSDYTWFGYGGKEYALTLNVGTWLEAQAEAVGVGGHLATISSAQEDSWLMSTFAGVFTGEPGNSYGPFIGLYQVSGGSEPAGGWQWISGEPLTYTNWDIGQPDDHLGIEDYGHYLNAGWNDAPGNLELAGIIEVPEPATILLLALGSPTLRKTKK